MKRKNYSSHKIHYLFLFTQELLSLAKKKRKPLANEKGKQNKHQISASDSDSDSDWVSEVVGRKMCEY